MAWYCSLLLSITAIMLAASQAIIFENIRASPDRMTLIHELQLVFRIEETSFTSEDDATQPSLAEQQPDGRLRGDSRVAHSRLGTRIDRAESQPSVASIRWSMVFVWQASMMLLAYSIVWFLVGFIVYVTAPLYDGSPFAGRGQVSTLRMPRIILTIANFSLLSPGCCNIPLFDCLCGIHFYDVFFPGLQEYSGR